MNLFILEALPLADSTLYFGLFLLALGLLILGAFSRVRGFALLSVPLWAHFAFEFHTDALVAITFAGLVLLSLYAAFRSDN
jgi:membrane protein implicated in regulation of membrane protease activity